MQQFPVSFELVCDLTQKHASPEIFKNKQRKERNLFCKTVLGLFKIYLCQNTFLYVNRWNLSGFSTSKFGGNFLKNGSLIWKSGVVFF